MSEFLRSIGIWFAENKDTLFATGTLTTLGGVVSAIILFIKDTRSTKENTTVTKGIITELVEIKAFKDVLTNLTNTITSIQTQINSLQKIVDTNDTNFKNLNMKIDAILDVQEQVYSTITDETLRKNIKNIILKTRNNEIDTITELKLKIEELQKIVNETTENLQKEMNKTVEEVSILETKEKTDNDEITIARA